MALIQTAVTGFPEYHKIDTLFERDPATFIVDPSKLKKPVLATIREWDVTEKIDGTNIRVMLAEDGVVSFGGRSDAAMLPADLLAYLMRTFPAERMKEALWIEKPVSAVMYGEGYGAGIQKGGSYVARKLAIDTVPWLGCWTLESIVEHVRSPFPSLIGTGLAEGVVARPIETLFDKRMERLIIKLKTKDFVKGKR